jgi:hypothetical protein
MNEESLIGLPRRFKTNLTNAVPDPALVTGHRNHSKEHYVSTIDIELMDAFLNAPTGLDGLAADMAELAQREPTKNRYPHPANPAVPDAIHAAQLRWEPRDARVIIERANALADEWEQVGNGHVALLEAACDLRLALAPHPLPRTALTPRRSTG